MIVQYSPSLFSVISAMLEVSLLDNVWFRVCLSLSPSGPSGKILPSLSTHSTAKNKKNKMLEIKPTEVTLSWQNLEEHGDDQDMKT